MLSLTSDLTDLVVMLECTLEHLSCGLVVVDSLLVGCLEDSNRVVVLTFSLCCKGVYVSGVK